LEGLYTQSKDSKDLEKKLLEFKGVGPTTVNIFLRELRAVWEKARPQPSPLAREVASRLRLGEEELELPAVESALVRLNLEFCKRRRCSSCPVREGCQEAKAT
jgi:endonuclease III